jgi:hypothetical protein
VGSAVSHRSHLNVFVIHGPRSGHGAVAVFLALLFLGSLTSGRLACAQDLKLDPVLHLRSSEAEASSLPQAPTVDGPQPELRLAQAINSLSEWQGGGCGGSCGGGGPIPDATAAPFAAMRNRKIVTTSGLSAAPESVPAGEPAVLSGGDSEPVPSAWRLPPIRWRGSLGNSAAWTGAAGQSSMTFAQSSDISVSSYIWQPWFLLVGGSGSLTQSTSSNSATDSRTKGTGLSGGLTLDLFPLSRFPVSAGFNAQQSKTKTDETTMTSGYTASLRGQYAPAVGDERYSGGYLRNVSSVEGKQVGSVDQIFADYSMPLPKFLNGSHALVATGSWSGSTQADHSNDNNFFRVSGKVDSDFYDDYGIRLYSNGEYYSNENVSSIGSRTVSVFQFGSSGSWVPEDDIPLSANGSLNFSSIQTEGEGQSSNAQFGSAAVSAAYRYNNYVSLNGGLRAQWNQSGSSISGNGGASASYSGEPREFGGFNYGWSVSGGANGTVSSASNGVASSGIGLSSGVSHQLNRGFQFGPLERLNVNLSQGVSMSTSATLGLTGTLTTSANATYTLVPRAASTLTANLSASDNQAFGSYGSSFQTLALTVNGGAQLSRYSTLSANVSASLGRSGASRTAGTDSGGANSNWFAGGSGTVSYQHGRAFGYNRLRYNAQYTLTPSGWGSSDTTTIGSQASAASKDTLWTHSFNQGVSYSLGRVRMSLTNSFSIVGQRQNVSIMLNVVREIGNY